MMLIVKIQLRKVPKLGMRLLLDSNVNLVMSTIATVGLTNVRHQAFKVPSFSLNQKPNVVLNATSAKGNHKAKNGGHFGQVRP